MVFSSVSFLAYFLPVLLLIYYLMPRRFRFGRNLVLLAGSLIFYAWGGVRYLALLLGSVAVNYACGLLAGGKNERLRRLGLLLAAVAGVSSLVVFKYAGFFARTVNSLGGKVPVPDIALPIGISFFTFQGLSYVADVYRGNAKRERNPLNVALYISMFPQLVAGPIVRYGTVAEAIHERSETIDAFASGISRFIFGLAKKLIVANAVGAAADMVFAQDPASLDVLTAWLGAICYTEQIYFDFSGYSDMAIGLGRMFGFEFPENFNYPYISKSVTEFWRRWHMSLSGWFRDYVYIPLGGSRCSKWKNVRNIFVVWLLTGLWHGANWTFVTWGLWFCALLLGEKLLWGRALEKAPALLRHIYAMLAAVISWVIFRSDSIGSAALYLASMFGAGGRLYSGEVMFILLQYGPALLLALIASMPIKPKLESALQNRKDSHLAGAALYLAPKAIAMALFVVCWMELLTTSFNPFIYFQF